MTDNPQPGSLLQARNLSMAFGGIASLGLALVSEEGWLFGQMSVEENLLMGAYPKSARRNIKRQMDFVFDLFPILADRKKQQEETLSGGERQMLTVGRGLMSNPKMLLLDEPSHLTRRYNERFRRYYNRKVAQANTSLATKALSNKLARICYYIMRDQVPFRENLLSQ